MTIFISQNAMAQQELTHYYLELNGADSSKFTYEIGIITYNKKFKPKKKVLPELKTLDDLLAKINISLGEENTSEIFNVFIHGIWANMNVAWNEMIRNLSRDVYSYDNHKQKVILSIIWDSSINYVKGVKIARKKGRHLGSFMKKIAACKKEGQHVNFLCHSMGNRIFQHMVMESGLLKIDGKVFDQYISVGGDLQNDIFEIGQPLHGIDKVFNDITIFVHNNDRSLKMSKLINKNKRLGLHGLPDIAKSPDNFRMIDISVITDNLNRSSSFSNHRYFYMSPTVMADLKRIIWDKDFLGNKRELGHKRSLKLLPK